MQNSEQYKKKDRIEGRYEDFSMSEYKFMLIKQKLEEALLETSNVKDSKEDPYEDFLTKDDDFRKLVYDSFGIYGGGFVFADNASKRLLYLHRKKLQGYSHADPSKIPHFIEIPFTYDYMADRKYAREKYGDVIDALFIGTRDDQPLIDPKSKKSPEFYYNLPYFREEEMVSGNYLPFERYLVKNGFKVIYCTVGEVLFHLYAWRLLFLNIQMEGFNGTMQIGAEKRKYIQRIKFWDEVGEREDIKHEYEWLKTLEGKFSKIKNQWGKLIEEVDSQFQSNVEEFSMIHEYWRMGLIEEDNINSNVTREFLALVRYCIHIAQRHLDWSAQQTISERELILESMLQEPYIDIKNVLKYFYTIERRLDIYFGDNNEFYNFNPTIKNIEEEFHIDKCISRVVKVWLFGNRIYEGKNEESLSLLLNELHGRTRFPILPYFYQLTGGKQHFPKEHIALCLWNSQEHKVEINLSNGQSANEAGVVFLLLSLKPMWRIHPSLGLLKNGKSEHCTERMSEEAYVRLFRILIFFRALVTPIIDRAYYGGIIQSELKRSSMQMNLDSFSHELSKIIDNIFDSSNISLKMFFKEKITDVAKCIPTLFPEETNNINKDNLGDWLLIPNVQRFKSWATILQLWSGRKGDIILEDLKKNQDIETIVKKCRTISKRMLIGESMKNWPKPENLNQILKYEEVFSRQIEFIKSEKKFEIEISSEAQKFRFYNGIGQDKEEINFRQNSVLRLLLASFTNTYEHSEGRFILNVKSLEKPKPEFVFTVVNPCKSEKISHQRKKSLGTEPVLRNCLNVLGGNLERFGGFDENNQIEQLEKAGWVSKIGPLKEGMDIWVTKFSFPIEGVFIEA